MIQHQGLDIEGAKWLLENIRTPMVRIDPRGMRVTAMGPGWGRAQLLAVNERKGTAIVQPAGHKQTEEIELRYLRKWNSKNELQMPLTAAIGEITMAKQEIKKPEPVVTVTKTELPVIYPHSKWKHEQMEEVKKLRLAGKSHIDISAITGIPRGSIGNILIRMGVETKVYAKRETASIQKPTPPAIPSHKEVAARLAPPPPAPVEPVVVRKAQTTEKHIAGKERILADAIQAILKTNMNEVAKLLAVDALTQPE